MTDHKQLRDVLSLTAESEKPVAPDTQRGTWNMAERWKDVELLASLTRRKDLPEDLIEKAAQRNEIPSRIAYLTRASLPREVLLSLLTTETRASVLAGVCDELDVAAFPEFGDILFAKLNEKSTKVLAEAIIAKDGFSAQLYVSAMLALGDSPITGILESTMGTRLPIIAKNREASERLLALDNSRKLPLRANYFLQEEGVSAKTRLTAIERYIAPAVEGIVKMRAEGETPNRIGNLITQVDRALQRVLKTPDLQDDVIAKIQEITRADAELTTRLGSQVENYDPGESARARQAELARIELAATTADPNEVAALLRSVRHNDEVMLTGLADNPNLTGEQQLEVFEHLVGYFDEALAWARRHRSDEVALRFYREHTSAAIRTDGYKLFTSIEEGKRLCILDSLNEKNQHSGYYNRWRLLEEVLDELGDDNTLLRHVPWQYLAERSERDSWYRRYGKVTELALVFAELQLEYLGNDPAKWETVTVISNNFTGTLEQLVQTAASL